MVGGILQISSYGSQDLFLTGTPEITFFKVVYRRHTPFSMESMKLDFIGPVGFGESPSLIVPKIGDLIGRTYLMILLPEINLLRFTMPDPTDLQVSYNLARNNEATIRAFMSVNRSAYVAAFNIFSAENSTSTTTMDIITSVTTIYRNNATAVSQFNNLLDAIPTAPFLFEELDLGSIVSNFEEGGSKDDLFGLISVAIDKTVKTQKFFFERLEERRKALDDALDENIKFAWVKRLGHAIIEEIEVRIGGHKVDRHYGDWLNIWYELSGNRQMEQIYMKLIGDVPQLTTFDRNVKPSYLMKIPLQFWFCRYSSLALPIVSLEYHNVTFHVKFRKFEELCYIENNRIRFSKALATGLLLDEVPREMGLNFDSKLVVDFIYLDSPERRRFAQSSHEYLIDQIQVLELVANTQQKVQAVINNFVHPSKELIWVMQQQKYTQNLDGFTECQWHNYSSSDQNIGNPIIFSSIDFQSFERVPRLDGNYFNYVQPYEVHRATPSDGINVYSFSLFPEEHQPSGAANLSRLSRVVINMEFDPTLFVTTPLFNIRVYTRNTNILRFISGMASLAFVYG